MGASAAVIAGLAVGVSFIVFLSFASLNSNSIDPIPPEMRLLFDGNEYEAGIGSYGGTRLDGSGYGADVDATRTLPQQTINMTEGSEIRFLSSSFAKPVLPEAWLTDSSYDQILLKKLDDSTFQIPENIAEGDYVLGVAAYWNEEDLVSSALYSHKVRIS